jgi:hypothetical protein
LGASPANVWGRWSFRSSDVESDENGRQVGEPVPSLERGPFLLRGRWLCAAGKVALRKRSGVLRKRAPGFGCSGSGEFGAVRGGTRSPGAWFAAAPPTSFVLKWRADWQGRWGDAGCAPTASGPPAGGLRSWAIRRRIRILSLLPAERGELPLARLPWTAFSRD